MFDYISVDNKWIPEHLQVNYDEQDYQTKDIRCALNQYEIHKDGRLFLIADPFDEEGEVFKHQNEFIGAIRFYDDNAEFIAWCVNGVVKEVIVSIDRKVTP